MEKVSEIQKINMKFDFDLLLGNAEMRGDPDNTGIWCCVKTETSTPVTECGDGTCEGEENCTNCPQDCGECVGQTQEEETPPDEKPLDDTKSDEPVPQNEPEPKPPIEPTPAPEPADTPKPKLDCSGKVCNQDNDKEYCKNGKWETCTSGTCTDGKCGGGDKGIIETVLDIHECSKKTNPLNCIFK